MVKFTPANLNTIRACVAWVLRALSVALLFIGAYLMLKKILFGLGTGQPNMIFDVYEGIGETHAFYCGVSMIAVGAALGSLAAPLARRIILVPDDSCPRCGYERKGDFSGKCPECGLDGGA